MKIFCLTVGFLIIVFSLHSQNSAINWNEENNVLGIDSPCTNLNFEDCSFNGWELFKGDVPGTSQYSYSNIVPDSGLNFHSITTGGNDPLVPVSKIFPGGNCSAMLGDSNNTGAKGASMKQTFFVDSSNFFLTFRYALVLEDPQHPINEQPYFRVRVYDSTGTSVACGQYDLTAGPANSGGDPDFIVLGDLSYKDWTTEFINLSNYSGQNLTVEYTVGDCAQGGHFGYAYIDGSCSNNTDGIRAVYNNGCGSFPVELQSIYHGDSYLWNTGDSSAAISADSNGIYTVTVTNDSGCSRSFSFDLQNNVIATVDFSFVNSCKEFPAVFTDLSTVSGGSIIEWKWDFGDNSSFYYQQNPEHFFDSAGVYNVTLSILTNSGCSIDTTYQLEISSSNVPAISGPDSVCIIEELLLFSGSDSGGTWRGYGITDSLNGIFNSQLAGPGIHLISYFVEGNCNDTGFHEIKLFENPVLIIDSVNQVSCYGGNDGAFFTSGSGGESPYSYIWGNGCLSCNPFNLSAGTYLYFISDINGCLDSSEISISQPDSLELIIMKPDVALCEGEMTPVSVNISGGVFPFSFQWNTGDTGQTMMAMAGKVLMITATDANGCAGFDSSFIEFFPLPGVFLGNDTFIFENDSIMIEAGNSGNSYLWNTGATSESISVNSEGEYFVIVSDSNGCSGSDTIYISVISTIIEMGRENEIRVFPNPAFDKIIIEKNYISDAVISIDNLLGEVMLQSDFYTLKTELDITTLPEGFYFIKVADEKVFRTQKIIVK